MTGNSLKKCRKLAIKCWFISIFCFAQFQTYSQQNNWTELRQVPLPDANSQWHADGQQNLYIVTKDQIQKISTTQIPAVQSFKKWQNIDQIEAINGLKILLFSSAQQEICFMDNTLSLNGNELKLEDFDISNATSVSISKRPDLIWIYDEFNSSLFLYNYVNQTKIQSVSNLKGMLNMKGNISIKETNHGLWVVSDQGQVVLLDDFMNEIKFQKQTFDYLTPSGQNLWIISQNKWLEIDRFGVQTLLFSFPEETKIKKIQEASGLMFIEFNQSVHIFSNRR